MLYILATLAILVATYYMFISIEVRVSSSKGGSDQGIRRQMLAFCGLMLLVSAVAYQQLVYDAGHLDRLDTYEALLPDVQTLLETNEASKAITELNAASFVSLLGYYGKIYPDDPRVWQKLAALMIGLQQPQEGLRAVRRFLQLSPNDLQGRQVELQLLAELVRAQNSVSPRQLEHALTSFLARKDISPEDRLYAASLAQEFEFYDLSIGVWEEMLASDQRSPEQLSAQAKQGRVIVQTMLEKAKASGDNVALAKSTFQDYLLGLKIEPVFAPQVQAALDEYFVLNPNGKAHIWLSALSGGPPMAARLHWLNRDDLLKGLKVRFTLADLVVVPDQAPDTVRLRAILVLDGTAGDPIAARQSPFQGEVTLNPADVKRLIELQIQVKKRTSDLVK